MVSRDSNGDFVRKAEHGRIFINHALVEKIHFIRFVETDYMKRL